MRSFICSERKIFIYSIGFLCNIALQKCNETIDKNDQAMDILKLFELFASLLKSKLNKYQIIKYISVYTNISFIILHMYQCMQIQIKCLSVFTNISFII